MVTDHGLGVNRNLCHGRPFMRIQATPIVRFTLCGAILLGSVPAVLAIDVDVTGTAVGKLTANESNIVFVTTGTSHGNCTVSGTSITCVDSGNYANGDTITGCGSYGGQGYCLVVSATAFHPVFAQGSSRSDITCETGTKAGKTFTLDDGDGSGSCGPSHDVSGKVSGGTCTKSAATCSSVDCDHGCGTSSSGCGCTEKK